VSVNFRFRRTSFSSHLKSLVVKSEVLRIHLNKVFQSPNNRVYTRRIDPSSLSFRLSLHRHSLYMTTLFTSRFVSSIINKKKIHNQNPTRLVTSRVYRTSRSFTKSSIYEYTKLKRIDVWEMTSVECYMYEMTSSHSFFFKSSPTNPSGIKTR
jgi:hypothetical protein